MLKSDTSEVVEFQTRVDAFDFRCFNNSGQDPLSQQSSLCYSKNFVGCLVELPFLSGLIL